MQLLCFIILLGLLLPSPSFTMRTNVVGPNVEDYCPPSERGCTFQWYISRQQTMMYYDGVLAHPVVWRNDGFYYRTECDTDDNLVALNDSELAKVHTGDGGYKYLTTVNGQFPGPSLVVYEGQEVQVDVTNQLFQESISIHWHGIKQMNTNWMDGVPGTTQCPINPEETFTYRFIASPAGTHWYHSHQGVQRADGFFGALIVLPNPTKAGHQSTTNSNDHDFTLPSFEEEFIMAVSENDPVQANFGLTSFLNNLRPYMFNSWNDTGHCFDSSDKAPNGVSAAPFQFHSGYFNGKGYYLDDNGVPTVDVPLETYVVGQDMYYRFRVIGASVSYAFKISVDEHPLVLIASDGMDITPVVADSFYINSGERYDFYIYTNQTVQNYYIRAETIEWEPHYAYAILRYDGANEEDDPTSSPTCMGSSCIVVNCPFPFFIRGKNMGSTCVNFESITSPYQHVEDVSAVDIFEHIISFEKTDTPFNRQYDTANGIMYRGPSTPPTVVGTAMYDHDCRDLPDCINEPCKCTHQVDLPLGQTVQIVILSNTTHPIHMHGYHFRVMKIGYPPEGYDPETFLSLMMNQDLDCNNDLCSRAFWRNSSWENGNVPGMNLINPPIKDTITIPAAGYVVLRFETDNPGWWLMHCHIDSHFAQGMGVLFQVGEDEDMTLTPDGFNTCGTFKMSRKEFNFARRNTEETVATCQRSRFSQVMK